MSLEIRHLAALHPLPYTKNEFYKAALSGRLGRYAHAYGFCDPFNYISLKHIYGGYNTARGLNSRDIAGIYYTCVTFCFAIFVDLYLFALFFLYKV